MAHSPARCQVQNDSPLGEARGNTLSLIRELLRQAIDESGWKHEALAAEMQLPNAAYLSRMLSGDKPISAAHLRALPDDIEQVFARKYAEAMGLVVVAPVHGGDAVRALVSGLVGLLAPPPPVPIRMAKAALRPAARKVTR